MIGVESLFLSGVEGLVLTGVFNEFPSVVGECFFPASMAWCDDASDVVRGFLLAESSLPGSSFEKSQEIWDVSVTLIIIIQHELTGILVKSQISKY